MKKLISILLISALAVISIFILVLSLRGNLGNPNAQEINTPNWKENGPFELSPERGRFALTYSLAQDKSFQFQKALGVFAAPDVAVDKNGKPVSLFAPTVSFIAIPGFIVGRYFGASQVGTYSVVAIFAIANLLLIIAISRKLGANALSASIAGLIFLFATPAFAYAVNLYQHHISTFCILLSLYLLLAFDNFIVVAIVFFLMGLSVTIDYPNFFLMLPLGIFALSKIIKLKNKENKLKISLNIFPAIASLAIIFPLAFLLWFNHQSYGNPIQLSGTLKTLDEVQKSIKINTNNTQDLQSTVEKTNQNHKKTAVGFFSNRNLLNGFYLHFVSPDRGVIYFTPVILTGLIGLYFAYKKSRQATVVITSIIGFNVVLYSLWGDPWGGWAFGSRYLIPTYAMLAIFISALIERFKKNIIFILIFSVVLIYSVFVNTAGALTSSANPPQVEVLALEKLSGMQQKYTFERNIDFLQKNSSKSFIFKTFANNYLSAWQYFYIVFSLIVTPIAALMILNFFFSKKAKND